MNKDERNDCEDFNERPPIEERPYHRCNMCGDFAFEDEGEIGTLKNSDFLLDSTTFVCHECIEMLEED